MIISRFRHALGMIFIRIGGWILGAEVEDRSEFVADPDSKVTGTGPLGQSGIKPSRQFGERARSDSGPIPPVPLPDPESIHNEFGLSYAQYLVVPRSALQSMPVDWQARFVEMIRELNRTFDLDLPDGLVYVVHTQGDDDPPTMCYGENDDPLADYERGRRRLEPRAKL